MSNEPSKEPGKTANAETNKPIPAQELTEKDLEGISGGIKDLKDPYVTC